MSAYLCKKKNIVLLFHVEHERFGEIRDAIFMPQFLQVLRKYFRVQRVWETFQQVANRRRYIPIPCLRKATVITDALLARNENNKITEGGDEDDYEFLIDLPHRG